MALARLGRKASIGAIIGLRKAWPNHEKRAVRIAKNRLAKNAKTI